jgi:hypothetical protein
MMANYHLNSKEKQEIVARGQIEESLNREDSELREAKAVVTQETTIVANKAKDHQVKRKMMAFNYHKLKFQKKRK